jgi:hypothetical protein
VTQSEIPGGRIIEQQFAVPGLLLQVQLLGQPGDQLPPAGMTPRLRTTERAVAHSLQFGTYALGAAGLLAALAVRPVPSCVYHYITRRN